jgi:glutamyl-Q tRNA(Asp) synthetase
VNNLHPQPATSDQRLDKYTGRFAPTPSGPLHFGSIVAALASYLEARAHNGRWLVRIDDLDTPRVKPGAADHILKTLERLHLQWDGDIVYQGSRQDAYREALNTLSATDLVYRCYCTRKQTKGRPYPGTCRTSAKTTAGQYALRVRTHREPVGCNDYIQGDCYQDLLQDTGDFIIRRADGLFAYHLAVTVDDAWQGITHVVRGADLLDSTPKQIYLQTRLRLPSPAYAHVPVAVDQHHNKISKRDGATAALLNKRPGQLLLEVLRFLGQNPEPGLTGADPAAVVEWAVENWNVSRVPRVPNIRIPT